MKLLCGDDFNHNVELYYSIIEGFDMSDLNIRNFINA